MARFGKQHVFSSIIVMLIVICAISIAGLFWFDYLGLIDAKSIFAPVLKLVGQKTRTEQKLIASDSPTLLDDERFAKQREAIEITRQELSKQEEDIAKQKLEAEAMIQNAKDTVASLAEKETSFKQMLERYESRKANIEQNARYLMGMPPQEAVKILVASDDQTVIDTLRSVEEIASQAGETSVVAYWLSLMPPDRAAAIQRKMNEKPPLF